MEVEGRPKGVDGKEGENRPERGVGGIPTPGVEGTGPGESGMPCIAVVERRGREGPATATSDGGGGGGRSLSCLGGECKYREYG